MRIFRINFECRKSFHKITVNPWLLSYGGVLGKALGEKGLNRQTAEYSGAVCIVQIIEERSRQHQVFPGGHPLVILT